MLHIRAGERKRMAVDGVYDWERCGFGSVCRRRFIPMTGTTLRSRVARNAMLVDGC